MPGQIRASNTKALQVGPPADCFQVELVRLQIEVPSDEHRRRRTPGTLVPSELAQPIKDRPPCLPARRAVRHIHAGNDHWLLAHKNTGSSQVGGRNQWLNGK
jgi:hypothetical protein